MMRMALDGEIKPVIHAVHPVSETGAAIQQLIDRDYIGKIVLEP
jgi:NADPH:quinone reductase-like Zn-dependent oxidoreductase